MQTWLKACLILLIVLQGVCGVRASPLQDYLAEQGRLHAAEGVLTQLLQLETDKATGALLQQAQAQLRAGRLEAAIEALEKAHGRTHAPLLKLALGQLYNRAGRQEDAIRIAHEALPAMPDSALPHDIQGTAYLGLNRPEQALRAYLEVVSRAPRQASGYEHLGDAYWALGRNGDALAHYKEALNCDSGLVQARLKIAALLLELGEAERSAAVALLVLEQAPDAPGAHAVLGEVHLARGELAQARGHFLTARATQPDRAYLQARLAEIHLREGETAKALAILEPLAARTPRDGSVQRLLARAYHQSGQAPAAAYHEGLAASSEGRPGEAEGHFRTVLESEPGHKGALLGLAAASLAQKKWSEAAAAAGRATEIPPPDAAAFCLLGRAQRGGGEAGRAEQSFRRALAIDARYAPAHLELARLLLAKPNCEEALEHYRLAIELGMGSDEIRREMALCR